MLFAHDAGVLPARPPSPASRPAPASRAQLSQARFVDTASRAEGLCVLHWQRLGSSNNHAFKGNTLIMLGLQREPCWLGWRGGRGGWAGLLAELPVAWVGWLAGLASLGLSGWAGWLDGLAVAWVGLAGLGWLSCGRLAGAGRLAGLAGWPGTIKQL